MECKSHNHCHGYGSNEHPVRGRIVCKMMISRPQENDMKMNDHSGLFSLLPQKMIQNNDINLG